MRRSSAPSSQSAAKRLRFLSPFINKDEFQLDKENDFFTLQNQNSETPVPSSFHNEASRDIPSCSSLQKETINTLRSTDEILKLISKPPVTVTSLTAEKTNISIPSNVISLPKKCEKVASLKTSHQDVTIKDRNHQSNSTQSDSEATNTDVLCFSVMWCKRSAKKHKIWEGDGILTVSNRSAVLKSMDGKVIDRGIGYKLKEIEVLEEGSKFYIGGKECEIQCSISSESNITENTNSPECDSMPSKNPKQTSM